MSTAIAPSDPALASGRDAIRGWAVDLTNVSKIYKGKVHALRGIEMRVRNGEIFGLLGPNGAGKSTLVKILMTVIRATRADGQVLGHSVGHKATLAKVGYLPEHHRFPDYLTGAQVLDFYAALSGAPRRDRKARAARLLDLVGMKDWADQPVRGYSKGMRQRVGIAQALMNDPALVVLDEPTDGVDPVGRRDIRVMLQQIRDEGRTVFLNSHLLSELELVCDRVAILVQGKVVSQGTIDELTTHRRCYELEVNASDAEAAQQIYRTALAGSPVALLTGGTSDEKVSVHPDPSAQALVGRLATGEAVSSSKGCLRIATTSPHVIQPIIDALRASGAVIRTVREIRPSLEDLFMEAVTDPLTGKALQPGADRAAGKGGAK